MPPAFKTRLLGTARTAVRSARHLRALSHLLASRFQEDRLLRVAGALSFTTILAAVPLTTVALAMLSIFPVFQSWLQVIQDFVYHNFVPAFGETVQRYMAQFTGKAGRLTVFGLLFLGVTSLVLMATIEDAFNDIWRVPRKRRLAHRFLVYWAAISLGPLLLGISLSLSSYLFTLPLFRGAGALHDLRGWLFELLPFALEVAAFGLLYGLTPNAKVAGRDALLGALFAAVLFEGAKAGFAAYVSGFSAYQAVYGAVAALPVFLIWIFLSWVVILLGATLTAVLPAWHEWRRGVSQPDEGTSRKRSKD